MDFIDEGSIEKWLYEGEDDEEVPSMLERRNLPGEEEVKFSKRGIIKQIEETIATESESKEW